MKFRDGLNRIRINFILVQLALQLWMMHDPTESEHQCLPFSPSVCLPASVHRSRSVLSKRQQRFINVPGCRLAVLLPLMFTDYNSLKTLSHCNLSCSLLHSRLKPSVFSITFHHHPVSLFTKASLFIVMSLQSPLSLSISSFTSSLLLLPHSATARSRETRHDCCITLFTFLCSN